LRAELIGLVNQVNCRRLDRKLNVFEGFFKNYWFMGIFAIMCGGQAIIVEFGSNAFQVVSIGGRDWAISIIIGLIAFPIGAIVRLLPTEPFHRFLIKIKVYDDPARLPLTTDVEDVSVDDPQYEFNPALSKIKDNLNTFANIRGGRINGSAIVRRSRTAKLRKADIQLPSILAMVPTLVAGTIAAGSHWAQPVFPREAMGNPAQHDPSRSTAELFQGKVQMHPDTDPNDPLIKKYGIARGD
jgi:Ca2+-transporting ATPase